MFDGITLSDNIMMIIALFFIIGVVTTKISTRFGLPALLLFILIGMIAGSDGLNIIYLDNPNYAQIIGIIALVVILFEGGLSTKWTTIRPVAAPSLLLATVGVLITSMIVAVGATLILGVTWMEGLLFGAIVGSTDAAAVFSVLKGNNIKKRLAATLEAESGTNDPMAMFLTLAMIEFLMVDGHSFLHMTGDFFLQMSIGLITGLVIGKGASIMINRISLDSGGLYPLLALGAAFLSYAVAVNIYGSGLLAVYVAALVIGNSDLTYRHVIFSFNEGFAWMMQLVMFVILGLLVFPGQLFTWEVTINGLLISAILIFIARPAAVWLSTIGFGYSMNEKNLLAWAGLRGAVPIVLATYPMIAGFEHAQLFFNVVFFVVLTSTLIQGSTISPVAKWLGLTGPEKTIPFHTLELISVGKTNVEMVEYQVKPGTAVEGMNLMEIPFPRGVLVNAVIREEELITPSGETTLQAEDILYMMTSRKNEKQLMKLLSENADD